MPGHADISSILIIGAGSPPLPRRGGKLMSRSALVPLVLLAACTAGKPAAPADPRAETLARLAKMTAHCGLPTDAVRLTRDGVVAIQTPPDTEYSKVDCLITEIKKTDLKQRYAFVGNAAYDAGNQQ
jgi:hypothetical protein